MVSVEVHRRGRKEEVPLSSKYNYNVAMDNQFSHFLLTTFHITRRGGNHFMFGGGVKGGQVLGKFPTDFEQGDADSLALSRGRMIPTTPWDAMWYGTAEWFGIPQGSVAMDKVLPMHKNFPGLLYSSDQLFGISTVSPTAQPVPTPSPTTSKAPTQAIGGDAGAALVIEESLPWE
jgi:hypothetical protein